MRANDKGHLQELIDGAAEGRLSRSDVLAIFALVREDAPHGTALRDIGDSIAHDTRDKGYGYKYVERFIQHVHDVFTKSGTLVVKVFLPIDLVLDELADVISRLGIAVDRDAMNAHRGMWVRRLAHILDGTTFNTPLADCVLRSGPARNLITFKEAPLAGAPGFGFGFPLLSE